MIAGAFGRAGLELTDTAAGVAKSARAGVQDLGVAASAGCGFGERTLAKHEELPQACHKLLAHRIGDSVPDTAERP